MFEILSPSAYTSTDAYTVSYCVDFSDNCIEPDDGQKYYWPKLVVDMLCVSDNIFVL
jgi:hypothetical protein